MKYASIAQYKSKYLLGGITRMPTSDFNTMLDWGTYSILDAHNLSNYPSDLGNGSAFLVVSGWKSGSQTRSYQVLYSQRGIARRDYVSGTWSDWAIVYDSSMLTNSTLLSPLASALGVNAIVKAFNEPPVLSNANITTTGVYRTTSSTTYAAGVGIIFALSSGSDIIQLFMRSDNVIYMRSAVGGDFTNANWKEL